MSTDAFSRLVRNPFGWFFLMFAEWALVTWFWVAVLPDDVAAWLGIGAVLASIVALMLLNRWLLVAVRRRNGARGDERPPA
jgi:hypothetical protein